ncbi:MAG: hypothetical protein EBU30_08045 [Synechococcaceae bacterium WB6_3B_236]|nr:hypothetical protein [Synechococcaceae bacterium WB6_3B_236]
MKLLLTLRYPLVVGLAAGLVWALCQGLGLASPAAYGVVIAALVVRPDFKAWPAPLFVALPLVVTVGLALGTFLKPLVDAGPGAARPLGNLAQSFADPGDPALAGFQQHLVGRLAAVVGGDCWAGGWRFSAGLFSFAA